MQETDILERLKYFWILFLPVLFLFCNELSEYDNQRIKEALGDSLITSSTSWNIDMDIMENGLLSLNLKSTVAHTINDDQNQTTYLSGPVFISIFESDTLATEVKADSAIYTPNEIVFELFGNVVVESKKGRVLFSDYLKWVRKDDKVTTPLDVLIITPTDSIAAKGFNGNSDLTNYTLTQVTGKTQFN